MTRSVAAVAADERLAAGRRALPETRGAATHLRLRLAAEARAEHHFDARRTRPFARTERWRAHGARVHCWRA